MQDYPSLPDSCKTILVKCVFPALKTIVRVDVLKMTQLGDPFELVALLAYVQTNID